MGETNILCVPKICLMKKWVVFKPKNVTNGSPSNYNTKFPSCESLVLFQKGKLRLRNFQVITYHKILMSLKSLPDTVLETLFSSFSQIRTFLISFSMDLGTHDLQDSQNTCQYACRIQMLYCAHNYSLSAMFNSYF